MEHINLDRVNAERSKKFYSVYDEQHIAITDLQEKVLLGDLGRACRFCKKEEPEVNFRKDAHLIPQAIGNRYLITSFECDTCNSFFGETYENSFSNFLSVSKVFAKVKNHNSKGKHSKHKETNRGLELEASETAYKITFSHLDEQAFSINKGQQEATLRTIIPSYIPLYVYKTFVKIGMGLIADSEVSDFSKCFRFLLDRSQDSKMKDSSFCKIAIHIIPGVQLFAYPTVILFTKKAELSSEPYPEKMLVLFFSNKIFQLFLPFNERDNHLIGKQSKFLSYPILIDNSYFQKYGSYKSIQIDFSSNEKKKGQKLTQTFSFDEIVDFSNSGIPKAPLFVRVRAFFLKIKRKVLKLFH